MHVCTFLMGNGLCPDGRGGDVGVAVHTSASLNFLVADGHSRGSPLQLFDILRREKWLARPGNVMAIIYSPSNERARPWDGALLRSHMGTACNVPVRCSCLPTGARPRSRPRGENSARVPLLDLLEGRCVGALFLCQAFDLAEPSICQRRAPRDSCVAAVTGRST